MLSGLCGRLGFFFQVRGQVETSRRWYERALRGKGLKPKHWKYYLLLLLHSGQFQEAAEAANRMSALPGLDKKQRATAYIYYGIAQWKLGDIDRALRALDRALADGDNVQAIATKGYLLVEKGDLDEAWAYNIKALEHDEQNSVILDSLGQIAYRRGDADARAWFERALKARPYQVDSLYYLAKIQAEAGEREAARETIARAASQPPSEMNTVARADIEALRDALA